MWWITCSNPRCKEETRAWEVVNLLDNNRDRDGWFRCWCGERGYVAKSFKLQEPGDVWEPYLKGAIKLGDPTSTYQPFVFLVGDSPDGPADQVWFSYYKDLRPYGGRLKMGYEPGGPPVLDALTVVDLLRELVRVGCVNKSDSKL
jgi:hypothetical protein